MVSGTCNDSENFVDANAVPDRVKKVDSFPETPELKKVRIQTGVVSRLLKEHAFYASDSEKLLQQIDEMKASNRCPHDIKQLSEVYAESKRVIPQVISQVRTARDKLFELTEQLDDALSASPQVLMARTSIDLASCLLQDEPVLRKQSDAAEIDSEGTEY